MLSSKRKVKMEGKWTIRIGLRKKEFLGIKIGFIPVFEETFINKEFKY